MKDKEWNPDNYGAHQGGDVLVRNENIAKGRTLCKRCEGTGNQLFSMYQKCSECNGKGYKAIKIFRVNDYEWYAAETLESAIAKAVEMSGLPADEAADEDASAISEGEMDTLVFYDDMYHKNESKTRTFRDQLKLIIDKKVEFPTFFAGTEC